MYSEVVLDEITKAESDVRSRLTDTVAKVLALAEAYRRLGKQFTFDEDEDLDTKVNRLLIELSDAVLEDTESRMLRALKETNAEEDEEDTIVAWVKTNKDAQTTLDKYASHLKFILEGWIAIGFAEKISKGSLITGIFTYMANPYVSPMWQKAFKEGQDYASDIIRSGGYHWGKGTPISVLKGMSIVEADLINTAYNRGLIFGFASRGAIGYRVYRGSNYDCPDCDEVCAVVHPIDEIVLPVHPNCVCYAVPIFPGEE